VAEIIHLLAQRFGAAPNDEGFARSVTSALDRLYHLKAMVFSANDLRQPCEGMSWNGGVATDLVIPDAIAS
jgi:hypothetical protein